MLYFCFPAVAFAQTYQQLSERAIDCIEKKTVFHKRKNFCFSALKLEPKNAKNALLFFLTWDWYNVVWVSLIKALESYSFALNFAPLAVPILLDRAAIYMEMGKNGPCLYRLLSGA